MKYACLALGTMISALAAEGGHAQTTTPPAVSNPVELETVTVTARKRAENLEDTPISITALSSSDLKQSGATNVGDIQSLTPNLSIGTSAPIAGSSNAAQIFIRGIGQTDFTANTQPGVGLYLDGVYIAHTLGGLLDLLDVSNVEVLRGPQGTLFGRNTIGGAVAITTKKPSTEFGGLVEADGGSYGEADVKGLVNVPISDKALTSISLGTENNDGYVKRLSFNGGPSGKEGDKHSLFGRGTIDFSPIDHLDIAFTIDGSHDREHAAGAVLIAADPDAQFSGFYNAVEAPALVPTLGGKAFFNSQYVVGPYKTYANGPNTSDDDVFGTNLTATYDLGSITVKSITAYRDTTGFFAQDYDESPLNLSTLSDDYKDAQVSQEFQLLGKAFDKRLTYVTGLYYFNERATDTNIVSFPVVTISSGGFNNNSSAAVFGQATYNVFSNLAVTGGLRYTYDTTDFTPSSFVISSPPEVGFPVGLAVVPPTTVRASFHNLSPEFNLSYHLTHDLMTYFNYSEGYKSGGFTQRVFPPLPAVPEYSPEHATVYEVGVKTTIAHRFRVNADVFHTDYTDVQVLVVNGIAPQTENAAKAEIDGAELETFAAVTSHLTMNAGAGYTDARYTKVEPGTAITLGDRFAFTPRWNLTFGASYVIDLPGRWILTPHYELSYRSSQNYDATNAPTQRQGGYALSNLNVTLDTPDKLWEGFLRVNNLFDRRYLANGNDVLHSQGYASGIYGAPIIALVGLRRMF